MDLGHLVDESYGPCPLIIGARTVADFVEVTGDDADRWLEAAPPGFAAAALFAIAPELLSTLDDHWVVHGEQTFKWLEPIPIDASVEVAGVVTKVRKRGGASFVGFDMKAISDDRQILEGSSLFVVSEADGSFREPEREEPPPAFRGEPRSDQVAASRADLVRYAAVTRDWNPIHWDHDSAVAAGLPGVVVHGLLQSSWLLAVGAGHADGARPITQARIRFRSPLPPAHPADVTVDQEDRLLDLAISNHSTTYTTARIELADG